MKRFTAAFCLAAVCVMPVLSGCSLLGCADGTEPIIKLQMPLAFSQQTQPTELPPMTQRTVFAAPVAPMVAAAPAFGYSNGACPAPAPAPVVEPLFGRRYTPEK
jgi:hypothetical protein